MSRSSMTFDAPAKLNLTLAVHGRRRDGFHEIESWVVPIDWADEVVFSPGRSFALQIVGPAAAGLRADDANLVVRAAKALAVALGREPDVAIKLTKRVPIGAGLGGGSSDAAAALRGLCALWRADVPWARLQTIAAELGSDVAFFLDARPAIIRGRGERIEHLPSSWRGHAAVIVPDFGLATASVYQRHAVSSPRCESTDNPWTDSRVNAGRLMELLFNDLEPAAFALEPRLAGLQGRLQRLGRPLRMTGSGSALFTLFDEQRGAEAWAEQARPLAGSDVTIKVVRTA